MVAYSFKRFFAPQIAAGVKHQTVRGDRPRHARPGEQVQLYTGMRTRHCQKIRPDVPCTRVARIEIEVLRTCIVEIAIDGIDLPPDAMESFAAADGFHWCRLGYDFDYSSLELMHSFWLAGHGPGRFDGVVVFWDPWPEAR